MPKYPLASALLAAGLFMFSAQVCIAADPSVHPQSWPARAHAPLDARREALVEDLLAHLTLQEKVEQMVQADIASITPEELRDYPLGSILAGGNAAPANDVRASAQAWLDMAASYHRAALAANSTAHRPIPILFGIDAVHGDAKVIGATIFPHNIALGAAHDPDLLYRIGQATAEEVASTGVDWTFAPTVAIARDVRWGRSYESYSESPELVSRYAPAMVRGLQGALGTPEFMSPGHTLSTLKHFLGDGGTREGRDQGDTLASEAQLREVHAAGYRTGLDAGALIVMASYNSWNGRKLHESHDLLTDVLKDRMAFDGFIVGDWNAQEQVPGCTKSDCAAAILAGVDMLMAPDGWKELYLNTLKEAQTGQIPRERIDDAVRRILRVKALAGLFEPAAAAPHDPARLSVLGSSAHRALAREAVRRSLVLLKNEHGLLPLDPRSHILVAGDGADDIGMQSGGWTIDWQGDHNTNADFPGATSIYEGIARAVRAAGGTVSLSREGTFREKPDVAVVVYGEHPYAEFEGDLETLEFSPNDKRALRLLRSLRAQGIPTVSIFLSGRPLWVNPELNASDAFVAAWLPGSEGEGIADVLLRAGSEGPRYDFTGRLSFSWPETAMPVRFETSGAVTGALFARGSGLDYESTYSVQRLSEHAQIPARWHASAGSLFEDHHVIAPWSIFLADGGAQVHFTLARQRSPHGALSLATDRDGLLAEWSAAGEGALIISGRGQDLSVDEGNARALSLRYRLAGSPNRRVQLAMGCGACAAPVALDVTGALRAAPRGAWRTLKVPLSCFAAKGADLKRVEEPFILSTSGTLSLTVGAVGLISMRAPLSCP